MDRFSLFSKRNSSSISLAGGGDRRPRTSIDGQQINPLLSDAEQDESRYYRSAEFQQALLEERLERIAAQPAPENPPEHQRRLSRHRLSRRMSTTSKSLLSFQIFDMDDGLAEQRRNEELAAAKAEDGATLPAHDTNELGKRGGPDVAVPSRSSESAHRRKFSRSRIRLHGIGPLIGFVRNRKSD